MAEKIIMPKQGLQMTEGTIIKWLVEEGGAITEGSPLFEMETDKLTITIDASASGTLLKIVRGEGEVVPITETIAIVGEPGEDFEDLLPKEEAPAAPAKEETPASATVAAEAPAPVAMPEMRQNDGGRVLVTPRAKTLADEKGVDYTTLCGSGLNGEVIEKDVAALAAVKTTPLARRMGVPSGTVGSGWKGKITSRDIAAPVLEDTIVPIAGMRKAIADNMMNSMHSMAQASHRIKVDMSQAAKMREAFKKQDRKISYNDILIFILSQALMEFPNINAVADDKNIYQKHYVNMGVAVAVDNGLLVPTIRNAQNMGLDEIHEVTAEKARLAKEGKLTRDDYSDGTFTITNLGMYGLDEFVAVINPPQVGIMAIGAIKDTPVAENGQVVIKPMLTLSLTYDHRVIDGAPAAAFMKRVKEMIENPYSFLL